MSSLIGLSGAVAGCAPSSKNETALPPTAAVSADLNSLADWKRAFLSLARDFITTESRALEIDELILDGSGAFSLTCW